MLHNSFEIYHFILHRAVESKDEWNYRKALWRKEDVFFDILFLCCFCFCILPNLPLIFLQSVFSPTCFSYASQYVSRYEAQGEGMSTQTSDYHQTSQLSQ